MHCSEECQVERPARRYLLSLAADLHVEEVALVGLEVDVRHRLPLPQDRMRLGHSDDAVVVGVLIHVLILPFLICLPPPRT